MSETLRVTSHFIKGKQIIIRGVPLDSNYRVLSQQYYVTITISNGLIPIEPSIGQIWEVVGDCNSYQQDKGNYKLNIHHYLNPKSVTFKMPNTGEAFIQFVARDPEFKGIGEAKAREIWHAFGDSIHFVLQEDSEVNRGLFSKITITKKSLDALYSGYKRYENLKHTVWMAEVGIDLSTQRRILKYHKHGTIDAIKSNPYQLINFGMSIGKIDNIVKEVDGWDVSDVDEFRIEAVAKVALNKSIAHGSTYATLDNVKGNIEKLLSNRPEKIDVALGLLLNSEKIAVSSNDGSKIYSVGTAIQELALAKRFTYLSNAKRPFNNDACKALSSFKDDLDYELTDKQVEAIKTAIESQVSCITGGAGTGKTTVLNGVLQVAYNIGYEISAVALSGRAAMRLHESIGFFTSTIARFLRDRSLDCKKGEKKLLVIDEASMIDLQTMYRIINHISPNVKLIFAGDPNQLPPIGSGKVLKDCIDSGVINNTMLDVVKRQEGDSGIPEYSNTINKGLVPEKLTTGAITFYDKSDEDAIKTIVDLYGKYGSTSRVIAPTNASVNEINLQIQSTINPNGKPLEFFIGGESYKHENLKQGDQVLFTANHYQEGVQNGTLGTLVSVEQTDSSHGLVRLDTGAVIELTEQLLDCIGLGYAITLHKAQGSQFPQAIVMVEKSMLVDRGWLYTAVTRAEKEVFLVGGEDDVKRAINTPSSALKRKTALAPLLEHLAVKAA